MQHHKHHKSLEVCSSLSKLETQDISPSLSAPPETRQPHFNKTQRLMKRQLSAPMRIQAIHKVAEPRFNVINNHVSHVKEQAKGVQTLALVRFAFQRRMLQNVVCLWNIFKKLSQLTNLLIIFLCKFFVLKGAKGKLFLFINRCWNLHLVIGKYWEKWHRLCWQSRNEELISTVSTNHRPETKFKKHKDEGKPWKRSEFKVYL